MVPCADGEVCGGIWVVDGGAPRLWACASVSARWLAAYKTAAPVSVVLQGPRPAQTAARRWWKAVGRRARLLAPYSATAAQSQSQSQSGRGEGVMVSALGSSGALRLLGRSGWAPVCRHQHAVLWS